MITVFFDRTCGKAVPEALKLLHLPVEAHGDHFRHNLQDDEWLPVVGSRGWVVVTHDKHIRTRETERQAIISYGVGCFVFTSGELNRWTMVRLLAKCWDNLQTIASEEPRPFIYSIRADGMLYRLYPPPG